MKNLLHILLLFLFSIAGNAQSVPVSSTLNDQILPGPCYAFSTIAALESKAMQAGYGDIDFYEWNMYSHPVIGGGGSSANIIPSVIFQSSLTGVFEYGDASVPASMSDLPNLEDPYVPGSADFAACNSQVVSSHYKITPMDPGTCEDEEGRVFELNTFTSQPFVFNGTFTHLTNNSSAIFQQHLANEDGIIANFNSASVFGFAHSVFIFRYNGGGSFTFKDSRPGMPGIVTMALDFSTISDHYILDGFFNPPPPEVCDAEISGSSNIQTQETYTLSGTQTNVVWTVPSFLQIVSSQGQSITVEPTVCNRRKGLITVKYGDNCEASKFVVSHGGAFAPDGIMVLSPNWNEAGETCPGEILELEVIDNNNPSYPETTYNWSIQGASPMSPNGGPTMFVQASSFPGAYLTFCVSATLGNCPTSAPACINGSVVDGQFCGNGNAGGPARSQSVTANSINNGFVVEFENEFLENQKYAYSLVTMNGRVLSHGNLDGSVSTITVDNIPSQLVFLYVYSLDGSFQKTVKLITK